VDCYTQSVNGDTITFVEKLANVGNPRKTYTLDLSRIADADINKWESSSGFTGVGEDGAGRFLPIGGVGVTESWLLAQQSAGKDAPTTNKSDRDRVVTYDERPQRRYLEFKVTVTDWTSSTKAKFRTSFGTDTIDVTREADIDPDSSTAVYPNEGDATLYLSPSYIDDRSTNVQDPKKPASFGLVAAAPKLLRYFRGPAFIVEFRRSGTMRFVSDPGDFGNANKTMQVHPGDYTDVDAHVEKRRAGFSTAGRGKRCRLYPIGDLYLSHDFIHRQKVTPPHDTDGDVIAYKPRGWRYRATRVIVKAVALTGAVEFELDGAIYKVNLNDPTLIDASTTAGGQTTITTTTQAGTPATAYLSTKWFKLYS